jgi:hypothetical protein
MNIYFLVEGEAELGVYPRWIEFLLNAKLQRVLAYDAVSDNNYFILNGRGIGTMIHHSIKNAVQDIRSHPVFDWFVIISDVDDQNPDDRISLIENVFLEPSFPQLPPNCQTKILVQNWCFETWLCGNRAAFALAQNNPNRNVQRFLNFYNVATNDPERMLKDLDPRFASLTLAKFHAAYLHHLLLPLKYNKGSAHQLIDVAYLQNLQNRLEEMPSHLRTLDNMVTFLQILAEEL